MQKSCKHLVVKYTLIYVFCGVKKCIQLLFSDVSNILDIKTLTNKTTFIYQVLGSVSFYGPFSQVFCKSKMANNGRIIGILCVAKICVANVSMWSIELYFFVIHYLLLATVHGSPWNDPNKISSKFDLHRTYWIHNFGNRYIIYFDLFILNYFNCVYMIHINLEWNVLFALLKNWQCHFRDGPQTLVKKADKRT